MVEPQFDHGYWTTVYYDMTLKCNKSSEQFVKRQKKKQKNAKKLFYICAMTMVSNWLYYGFALLYSSGRRVWRLYCSKTAIMV